MPSDSSNVISELHLAPDGRDEPGQSGSEDAPLASLSGALERLRQLKQTASLTAPLTVWVHGGVYPLRKTVVITPGHSAPVTFKAVPGETPVFDGGLRLTGWRQDTLNGRTVWSAPVPDAAISFGSINQFFVNQLRKTRASFPKKDFLRIASPPPADTHLFAGSDRFVPPADGFPGSAFSRARASTTTSWPTSNAVITAAGAFTPMKAAHTL